MLEKIKAKWLAVAVLCASGFSLAATDIVIYGNELKDDYPDVLKSWEVTACADPEQCLRLTDPMANCIVRNKSIRCGAFTYHCESGSPWHVIDKGYNADYFCTAKQPQALPPTPVGGSNF